MLLLLLTNGIFVNVDIADLAHFKGTAYQDTEPSPVFQV